tara:strand:+ start:1104 stop:1727 length:624 start_codon:yes stop_codon:yes gene_type:complete
MIDLYQFPRLLNTKITFILVGLVMVAITGCVDSRPRYTVAVPTPTIIAVPLQPIPKSTVLPDATPTPQPSVTPVPQTPTPRPIPTITPTPTAVPIPTPTPTIAPTIEPDDVIESDSNSGTFNLSLDFEGIGNESVVRSDRVLLHGVTSPDAIVSVNGVILEVQPDGTFELTLPLEPGPNIVDIVASDLEGNSINSSLAIISIPEDSG